MALASAFEAQVLLHPDGPLIRTLEGHTAEVMAVAVTPDGRRAVSGSAMTDTLRALGPGDRPNLRTLEGHTDRVSAVAVTPDGRRAVSGSGDRHAAASGTWRAAKRIRTLEGHTGRVCAVAVTPDGRRAVSGSDDRTLRALGPGDRPNASARSKAIRPVSSPWRSRPTVAARVSGSDDRTLRLWDLDSGQTTAHARRPYGLGQGRGGNARRSPCGLGLG